MRTFFSKSELPIISNNALRTRVPNCEKCGLYKTAKSPKMEPTGKGRRKILIVAEAPGQEEDEQGIQLVGNSSKELSMALARHGINLRKDCVLENSLRCRPPRNEIKNRKCIDFCRPNVLNTIEEHNPNVIVLLGGVAVRSVLGHLWKEDPGGITRWAGYQIPHQRMNAWICPTYHPSYLLREKSRVLDRRFDEHLKAISEIDSKPWDKPPEWSKEIELIFSPEEAARRIDQYTEGVVAFDYETNCLKPDHDAAKIYCCSICYNGRETIAFPWHGPIIPAMKRLFQRNIRFMGANIKFEDRWTRAKLGVEIGNRWLHCSMNGAHVIWNASKVRKITSVKFQAFALYGLDAYDDYIQPYLKSKKNAGGNALNRIHLVDMKDLLLYCGIDSFVEHKTGIRQMKILKRGVI